MINEGLLEKDIQYIEYYAREENETLRKIHQVMEDCINNYTSANSISLSKKITKSSVFINRILSNRKKYCSILKRVITRYINTANKTKRFFDGV